VGSALGVAVIGSILTSGVGGSGFVGASRGAWWAIAAGAVAVLALGVLTTGRWARATADATARRMAGEPALVD
jgi:hypothetical protein